MNENIRAEEETDEERDLELLESERDDNADMNEEKGGCGD